ncbi:MAG: glycosyltransferase family 4 protein, partial [Rhodospirillaceae bacterium]
MSLPRTVLMTADAVGGVWRYAVDLADGLGRHGTTVVLAVMGPPPDADQRREVARLRGVTLIEGPFALEWMDGAAGDMAPAGDWLLGLEREWQPDVIHLNGYSHAVLPWRAPVLVVAHSCVLSWWRAVKGCDAPAEWQPYAQAVTRGLRAATLVTAPTRAFLEDLNLLYGPLGAARVVPNGLNPDHFTAVPDKDPMVLAAGRVWDEAKNLALLGTVAERIDWPVAVAGDAVAPDGGHRLLPGVQALGRLSAPAMARQMARAGVFASPARYEPFGLAVLEAALSGCALVLSDIPTFRELWGG